MYHIAMQALQELSGVLGKQGMVRSCVRMRHDSYEGCENNFIMKLCWCQKNSRFNLQLSPLIKSERARIYNLYRLDLVSFSVIRRNDLGGRFSKAR